MKSVYNKTLTSMFKKGYIITTFILVIIVSLLFNGLSLGDIYNEMAIPVAIEKLDALSSFLTINFVWISGMLIVLLTIIFGTGLFANEEAEGTMRILLAKPVKREGVIFGKILGYLTGLIIYLFGTLILHLTIYAFVSGDSMETVSYLVSKVPLLLIYGLFIILFFGGISCFLSTVFKKKVATIIISIVFVILAFGIIPIARGIISASGNKNYEQNKLYIADINYHFGSMYGALLEKTGNNELSPNGKNILGVFTGLYMSGNYDQDITSNEDYVFPTNYLNGFVMMGIYSAIAISLYMLCYIRMMKKDIT